MIRQRVVSRVVLSLTVLFLVVAAVWAALLIRAEPATEGAPVTDQCPSAPAGAVRVEIDADGGLALGGAVVGPEDAAAGLVVRQGGGESFCDWLPLADRIASETETRVLLFDRRGEGASPGKADLSAEPDDVVTAVAWLRSQGTVSIGLLASGLGNASTYAALPDLSPTPCVVVSVSPVLQRLDGTGGVDGTALAKVPSNVWVVNETRNQAVVTNARRIATASRASPDHRLAIEAKASSLGLVRRFPEVADFVVDGVDSCR
jgi:alpha/beta superfamily hydrolase